MIRNKEFELEYLHFLLGLAKSNGDQERVSKIEKEILSIQNRKEKIAIKTSCRQSGRELC